MLTKKFLKELLSKEDKLLSEIIRELSEDDLYWQPGPESNSIGWIIWHMARVEDMWIQFFSKREMEKGTKVQQDTLAQVTCTRLCLGIGSEDS